jgi:hypothetical protein
VCTAAAAARTERAFFAALEDAGVLVRKRYSTVNPGQVTGYAVGRPNHRNRDGVTVWYGGGKLAADLTLPKLRRRWAGTSGAHSRWPGRGLSAPAARAVLRNAVTAAAEQARAEAEFFAHLRHDDIEVRLRFGEIRPGQVTGYAVTLPGHHDRHGRPLWYSGGKLSDGLTLPRLRRRWGTPPPAGVERSGAGADRFGTFRLTVPERDAIYELAAQQAAAASEHIRRCAQLDPAMAADAAWAAADTLHAAARVTGNQQLRRAADAYDRAARALYGRIPRRTEAGERLRTAARVIALTGRITGEMPLAASAMLASLLALAAAVAELRQAQQHAAQASAARAATERLHAAVRQMQSRAPNLRNPEAPRRARPETAADVARRDFPRRQQLVKPVPSDPGPPPPTRPHSLGPVRRAGPGH